MFQTKINYIALSNWILIQICAIIGFYLAISLQTNYKTIIYHFILGNLAILGALMGAHRLWSHRSFEANKPIQFILLLLGAYSGQPPAYIWARDHRLHHKYADTDADPYSIKRGIFFAQMGWYLMRKTKDFKEKVQRINLDDLHANSLVMFQYHYQVILVYSLWVISAALPWLIWAESYFNSFMTLTLVIYIEIVHVGTINSLSHWWGWKPYDTSIEPTFNRLVAYLTFGEGYHNFHHTFPIDYSQSELDWTQNFNLTAMIIDLCEYCGWVTNKKTVSKRIINERRRKTGDLSVRLSPWFIFLDQINGLLVHNWAMILIFGLRSFDFAII